MIRMSNFLKALVAAIFLAAAPTRSDAFFFGFGFGFGGGGWWNPYYYGWGYPGFWGYPWWGYHGWDYPYAYGYPFYRPFHYFAYSYPAYPAYPVVVLPAAEVPKTQEK